MQVGASRLNAVVELDRLAYPARFLDGHDPLLVAPELVWAAPEHVDPQTGDLLLSHHAWLVDILAIDGGFAGGLAVKEMDRDAPMQQAMAAAKAPA